MVHRHAEPVYIPYAGPTLLGLSLLNKGTAFSEAERQEFNLNGLIPHCFETMDEQARRAYLQYCSFKDSLNKHIYLRGIQDSNETLFYRLLQDHIDEMLPIIYTPTVGDACERFSEIFRRPRGLFISYPNRHRIDELLHNATKMHVKVIVVTDGSRILGLGDQGIGGMGISIGKLSLYSACGGISPAYTLPIMLDVGTNNEALRRNPMYMGWRHERIDGQEYDEFMQLFIDAVKKRWPHVLLQFEDFQQSQALKLLNTYRDQLCCFNDDIQGTAAVTVGSLMAACRGRNSRLRDQYIVIAGAGSAGCGIAEQVVMQMRAQGLTEVEARNRIWMVDKDGLLTEDTPNLYEFQHRLAQPESQYEFWEIKGTYPSLSEVVEYVRPTILIGASGQPGLFDRELITLMLEGCDAPIIFPLSNPSKNIEAVPADLIEWTQGKALVATGSPFADVHFDGQTYPIAQCNNSYIFPGIGLAAVAGRIDFITDQMLVVASEVLAQASPMANKPGEKHLLPALSAIHTVSKKIALAVALQAQKQGLAQKIPEEKLRQSIEDNFWLPEYRHYKRVSL